MDINERKTLFRIDSPQMDSTCTGDQKLKVDGENHNLVHLKEDVSTLASATLNDNTLQKVIQSKPETNFDQQQKQIQVF